MESSAMVDRRAVQAGVLYCTVVFAAGFVLGVIRTLWVAPLSGELVAVALEAPIILAIAWHTCSWVAERLDIAHQFLDRLVMGGVALLLLLGAEAVAGFLVLHRPLAVYLQHDGRSALLLGLLLQLAFAIFPLLQGRRTS